MFVLTSHPCPQSVEHYSNKTKLVFTMILIIILNYLLFELGSNPFPKEVITLILRVFFSLIKRTNSCCNEICVRNNLNTILNIARDFYKNVELVTLSVTTFSHPYSLFAYFFIFTLILQPRRKASKALYLEQTISSNCF